MDAPASSHGEVRLHRLFERQVVASPGAVALAMEGRTLSYGQLNRRANRLARHLRRLGVGPDVLVGVCAERSMELVQALLAVLKAGGAFVPLDPSYPGERLRCMLEDARPSLVLAPSSLVPQLPGAPGSVMALEAVREACAGEAATDLEEVGRPTDLAYVMFTSGSTGRPKGAMNEHRGICNKLGWLEEALDLGRDDCFLLKTPISFDVSVEEIFAPLVSGGRLVIARPGGHRDPAYLLEVIRTCGITVIEFVPSMLHLFLEHPAAATCVSLRHILCGGESLPADLVERCLATLPGAELHNLYGPTEAAIGVLHWRCRPHQGDARVPIGHPIANTTVHLLDAGGSPVPIGEPGDLHIGGVQVGRGYVGHDDLTQERFFPDPFSKAPTALLYRTGDLARQRPDGAYEYLGRLDDQVKLHGQRLEIGEIEAALDRHPAVARSLVALREGPSGDPLLVAYVLPAGRATPAAELPMDELTRSWREHLRGRLPAFMVPSAFVPMEALPLTPSGKLDRRGLPAPTYAPAMGPTAPLTPLESQLHRIWTEVLGHGGFGLHDDFFLLGGHSLAAARLASRVESQLGRNLPIAWIFEAPTIAALAGRLTAAPPAGAPVPALPREGPIAREEPLAMAGGPAYPASFSQSRLWFLEQLEAAQGAYAIHGLWRLQGQLDQAALQTALTGIVERHQALRTSFRLQGDRVLQVIEDPPQPVALPLVRLGDGVPLEQARIRELLADELGRPFDLARPPLLRALLVEGSPLEHLLLVSLHHIAGDGWSCTILHRELSCLYATACRGESVPLPPLPLQYTDFAGWQRQGLTVQRRAELLAFWQAELKELPNLELPTDHPRPPQFSYRGEAMTFCLDGALSAGLERFCHEAKATLQMGLVSLVAILLHRYSRQQDFALGVPAWGRSHPDLEALIGFFVNTLVVRTRFEEATSFRSLLDQVRRASLVSYDHQDLPFEQLVEGLRVERNPSHNPLVQVMVQLLDLPSQDLELEGLALEPLPPPETRARMDLEVLFQPSESGLRGTITYCTDLFNAERIRRLIGHLEVLLGSCLGAPDLPVGRLDLLRAEELRQLRGWSEGPTGPLPPRCVHELFEAQVRRSPQAVALEVNGFRLSYAELNARANRLARLLQERGVVPELIVAVCLDRSADLVIALLAILKAGGAYLPLDPAWPDQRLSALLAEAAPPLLITSAAFRNRCWGDGVQTVVPEDPALAVLGFPDNDLAVEQAPGGLAYVLFTSGSTGTPKGVAVEHRSIVRLVFGRDGLAIAPGARVLQLAPAAFDAATYEIWGTLLQGGRLVLAPPGPPSLRDLAGWLVSWRISVLWLTAALFHAMVDEQLESLCHVRTLLAGGDVLSAAHVRRLLGVLPAGHRLINGYGPTENTTFTCCHRMASGDRLPESGVPIGRPIGHTLLRVLEPSGRDCPIGVPGELFIGGAGLARGYLNAPALTQARFITTGHGNGAALRLYRSGDLVAWNGDGTLAFLGRLDDQIKLRGYRIDPEEIEAALMGHGGVEQACVRCLRDGAGEKRLVAWWVPSAAGTSDGGTVRDGDLRSHLIRRVPAHMVPAAFVRMEAFPLTPNGKLDRRALPDPNDRCDRQGMPASASELESCLHGIWAEVLGHGDFGVHDNFFALGGHSLTAARLLMRLQERLGMELAMAQIFEAQTIAEQAALLGHHSHSRRTSCVVPLQPQGDLPPLFLVHGKGGDVFGFLPLARAFAPERPVFGVQAIGVGRSIEAMAQCYAREIHQRYPRGPYHLIGFSAGGWMAYATAEALLQQGFELGMVGLLDTQGTARIHRRLSAVKVLGLLLARIPIRLQGLLSRGPAEWPAFLTTRRRNAQRLLRRLRRPADRREEQGPVAAWEKEHDDDFLNLHADYRPPRLPLRVDVFGTAASLHHLRRLWRFYARGGVMEHVLFERHVDYIAPERSSELAAEVRRTLADLEQGLEAAGEKPPAAAGR